MKLLKILSNLTRLLKKFLIKIIIKNTKVKNISSNSIIKNIFDKIIKSLAKFKNRKKNYQKLKIL